MSIEDVLVYFIIWPSVSAVSYKSKDTIVIKLFIEGLEVIIRNGFCAIQPATEAILVASGVVAIGWWEIAFAFRPVIPDFVGSLARITRSLFRQCVAIKRSIGVNPTIRDEALKTEFIA
jgi:hypothetical protein